MENNDLSHKSYEWNVDFAGHDKCQLMGLKETAIFVYPEVLNFFNRMQNWRQNELDK